MNFFERNPRSRPILVPLALVLFAALFAAPAQASFPGRPGAIVYPRDVSSESGDTGGLFLHGPRASQKPHALTPEPADGSPAVSADGGLIAFSGNREPPPTGFGLASHIYVIDAAGGGLRQVTSGAGIDRDPSFSPDGTKIVFDRATGSGKARIYVVDLDGSGLESLTDGSSSATEPVFTPNGRRIVYTGSGDTDARSDHSDIFAMGPHGENQRVLIDGIRDESEPDVSPNGRAIVFVSNRDHGPNLFIARANGSHLRQLTHSRHDCFSSACYLSPVFSPDGRHIAYLRVGRYGSDLEVSRPDGSGEKTFEEGGTEEEGYGTRVGPPAWGPRP